MNALSREWALVSEISRWEEWTQFSNWLDSQGAPTDSGHRVDIVSAMCQINTIVNEQQLFSVKQVFERRSSLPCLDEGLINEADFEAVMLQGHNTGYIPIEDKKIVLVQGLVLRRDVEVGSYGRLISLDASYVSGSSGKAVSAIASHLYSGFLTTEPIFMQRAGLISLMAALRSFQYARAGDLRYYGKIGLYRSLTGMETTLGETGTVVYTEETSLFGSESPRLTQVGKPGAIRLAKHIEMTLEGFQQNLVAAELLNCAFLAPKYLQVPSLFSALEAVFVVKSKYTKKYALAAFVACELQLPRPAAEFVIKMYDLRNAIMHSNENLKMQVLAEIHQLRGRHIFEGDLTSELKSLVCQLFAKLMKRDWEPDAGTRELVHKINRDPELRQLLQKNK